MNVIKRVSLNVVLVNLLWALTANAWSFVRYGETYCHDPKYHCIKVKRADSWSRLFPDHERRDVVKRINRMNVFLKPGMIIAVPVSEDPLALLQVAPFQETIPPPGEKKVVIDPKKLAWGAYDNEGRLIRWGPAATGSTVCSDPRGNCSTPAGQFRALRKKGADCVSGAFPRHLNGNRGGAAMPFCIFFYKGYALHASDALTGRASSHGCVNLFKEDAQWLSDRFIELPEKGHKGTLIEVLA